MLAYIILCLSWRIICFCMNLLFLLCCNLIHGFGLGSFIVSDLFFWTLFHPIFVFIHSMS